VRGYSQLDIGTTVFVSGIFTVLFGAPIASAPSRTCRQRALNVIGVASRTFSRWGSI